jgi:hypothetical protein
MNGDYGQGLRAVSDVLELAAAALWLAIALVVIWLLACWLLDGSHR